MQQTQYGASGYENHGGGHTGSSCFDKVGELTDSGGHVLYAAITEGGWCHTYDRFDRERTTPHGVCPAL